MTSEYTPIGNGHLTKCQSIEQIPAIISHIVDDQSLAHIKAHTESPLLPFYEATVYGE